MLLLTTMTMNATVCDLDKPDKLESDHATEHWCVGECCEGLHLAVSPPLPTAVLALSSSQDRRSTATNSVKTEIVVTLGHGRSS
jgi:hypothetical protein